MEDNIFCAEATKGRSGTLRFSILVAFRRQYVCKSEICEKHNRPECVNLYLLEELWCRIYQSRVIYKSATVKELYIVL